MQLSRRQLVIGSLGAIGASSAGLVGCNASRVMRADCSAIMRKLIRVKLGYLKLEDAAVDSFVKVYPKELYADECKQWSWISIWAPLYPAIDVFRWFENYEHNQILIENMISRFLLSTDFFWNGGNVEQTAQYLEYFDPYQRGCSNPFANLSLDEN